MADPQKNVAVIVGDEVHDIAVLAGTTAADILAECGAPGDYWLATRDGQPFGPEDNVYARVNDGDKLVAAAQATVAGGLLT